MRTRTLLIVMMLSVALALPAGATVAHLAFYLAVYLGCDPIIFVGQDLAYTGHVFYVPGVEIHQAWQSELNRFAIELLLAAWRGRGGLTPLCLQDRGRDVLAPEGPSAALGERVTLAVLELSHVARPGIIGKRIYDVRPEQRHLDAELLGGFLQEVFGEQRDVVSALTE